MWAAAAAVALIGASTALLMPERTAPTGIVANQNGRATSGTSPSASNYTPYIFNTGLSDAKDEGVSWHQADRPHRIVKVVYIDHITLKNAEGKTIVVEQPRTEYILVPEKMD